VATASAALLALLSLGLCFCPEASGAESTCHGEAAATRMTASCCCGESPALTAAASGTSARGPERGAVASVAPPPALLFHAPELSPQPRRWASTAAHSPPSLLQPPLRSWFAGCCRPGRFAPGSSGDRVPGWLLVSAL